MLLSLAIALTPLAIAPAHGPAPLPLAIESWPPPVAQDDDPIKVGILHSLSGTMAISESTLKDTVEMLIEQQNEAGGLLGRQLEAVVVDPASNWPLFAERARELLAQEEVDVIFGNWTSVSRKAVLPVFEQYTVCCITRRSMKVWNSLPT